MNKNQLFDKLNWLIEKRIGKVYSFNLCGFHLTLHVAKYKNGYWIKETK